MRERFEEALDEPLVRAFGVIVVALFALFLAQLVFDAADGDLVVPDGPAADDAPQSEVSTTGGMLNVSARQRVNESEVERLVHSYVNDARRSAGRDRLDTDAELADVARFHSDDMARSRYLGHRNERGLGPTRRANEHGYRCLSSEHFGIGENVARTYFERGTRTNAEEQAFYDDERELARGVVGQWMRSEGHRRAMLAEFFDRSGTGVTVTDDGTVYVTQMFC